MNLYGTLLQTTICKGYQVECTSRMRKVIPPLLEEERGYGRSPLSNQTLSTTTWEALIVTTVAPCNNNMSTVFNSTHKWKRNRPHVSASCDEMSSHHQQQLTFREKCDRESQSRQDTRCTTAEWRAFSHVTTKERMHQLQSSSGPFPLDE